MKKNKRETTVVEKAQLGKNRRGKDLAGNNRRVKEGRGQYRRGKDRSLLTPSAKFINCAILKDFPSASNHMKLKQIQNREVFLAIQFMYQVFHIKEKN